MATTADVDGKEIKKSNSRTKRGGVRRLLRIMVKHPEICLMSFAIVLTFLSRYTKSSPDQVFTSQPPPRSFFPTSSVVLDFPYGNVDDVLEIVADEEVLVIMYYAPWCSASKRFHDEFVHAAEYMKDEVTFVAVNCWHPGSECRRKSRFVRYPVISFYHTRLREFRYKGVLTAEHLVHFVEQLLRPYIHLRSTNEFATFLGNSDNSMIGYFDMSSSPQPPGFQQFYYAAMRVIEAEPRNKVKVAIVTERKLAAEFQMHESPRVLLVRSLNGTVRFPASIRLNCSGLLRWVFSVVQQPLVKWMLPRGVKTLALSSEINKGPAMILFTQDMPLSASNQLKNMLREVALDYSNCQNTTRLNNLIKTSIYLRWRSFSSHIHLTDTCRRLKPLTTRTAQDPAVRGKHCCETVCVGSASRFNSCDICFNYQRNQPLSSHYCVSLAADALSWQSMWNAVRSTLLSPCRVCGESMPTYKPGEFVSFCCGSNSSGDIRDSFLSMKDSSAYIRDDATSWQHRLCRKLHLAQTFGWFPAAPPSDLSFIHDNSQMAQINGLRCRTARNRTLNFYAMDIRRSYMFLEKSGIKTHPNQKPIAVIFDKQNEAQYLLEDVSKLNIAKFIENFTKSELPWFRRSTVSGSESRECSHPSVCVQEVTKDSFHRVVMQQDMDVVLLYYAPWCGFCASFAHVYLSLARYFSSAKNIVFARINADRNDLAWQFTMDVYPAITFFPAFRKTESVTFPEHFKKSLPNLIEFVQHYASLPIRLSVSLALCTRHCFDTNLYSATARIADIATHVRRLQRRVAGVKTHLQNFASGSVTPEDTALAGVHADVLHQYLVGLQIRLHRQRQQLAAVRTLYDVLMQSNGDLVTDNKLRAFVENWWTQRAEVKGNTL